MPSGSSAAFMRRCTAMPARPTPRCAGNTKEEHTRRVLWGHLHGASSSGRRPAEPPPHPHQPLCPNSSTACLRTLFRLSENKSIHPQDQSVSARPRTWLPEDASAATPNHHRGGLRNDHPGRWHYHGFSDHHLRGGHDDRLSGWNYDSRTAPHTTDGDNGDYPEEQAPGEQA